MTETARMKAKMKARSLAALRLWKERNADDGKASEKYALIRVARADGASYAEIADVFGVSRQAIQDFVKLRERA